MKSLCVIQENSLTKEVGSFNSQIREEIHRLSLLEPTITKLISKIVEEMEKGDSQIETTEADEEQRQCWKTKVNPIERKTYNTPPKINSLTSMTEAKTKFTKFLKEYRRIQARVSKVLKKMKANENQTVECTTTGILGFIRNFTPESLNMKTILALILSIIAILTASCCYCCCLVCIIIKVRKPRRQTVIETYDCNEQIPLSQRRQ